MRTIWKYPVVIVDSPQVVDMPAGSEIVHFAQQDDGSLCFWALVNPTAATRKRTFYVHGKGHSVSQYENHVGTAICGYFVWHLFEETL